MAVDGGQARFRFRAFLGGFVDQGDAATATVTFRDASQQPLGDPFVLGPVTALEREDQTGLLPVEAAGVVPPTALILRRRDPLDARGRELQRRLRRQPGARALGAAGALRGDARRGRSIDASTNANQTSGCV